MSDSTSRKAPHDGRLTIQTLGGWALSYSSPARALTPVFGPSKPLAMLVYLALSPNRTAARDHLIDMLWADVDPDSASHALRQTIWYVRQRTGNAEILKASGGMLSLVADITLDRDDFIAAIEAQQLERALELYTGDFCRDFAAPGGAEFEKWADLERDRLRAMFVRAGALHCRRLLADGRARDAAVIARRIRNTDPESEFSWRLVLESLVAAGDSIAAAAEADALDRWLANENRIAEPATRTLLGAARQSAPAPAEGTPATRGYVSALIAREREFRVIVEAWDAASRGVVRHVHVTGAPGFGKSRLLADAQNRLRATGARCLLLRANPGERHVPHAFAADIASALATLPGATGIPSACASSLVGLNPALSALYPNARADTGEWDELHRRRRVALEELMRAVAHESPVAIMFDDIQWSDPASRQLLAGSMAHLADAPVLLITAARPVPDGVLDRDDTEHLFLEPLTRAQVLELVTGLGTLPDESWATDFAGMLHKATTGAPLLILETLELARERDVLRLSRDGWTSRNPAELHSLLQAGGALRARVTSLTREQAWLLLILACAGFPCGKPLLAVVATRELSGIEPDLLVLEQKGLARREQETWQPAHDAVAEMAIETARAEAIHAAHHSLGRALSPVGADAVPLVRAGYHFRRAGDPDLLAGVFARWFAAQRRQGDRRGRAALAREFLGDDALPDEAARLAGALPLRQRLGIDSPRRAAAAIAALAVFSGALYAFKREQPVATLYLRLVDSSSTRPTIARVPIRLSDWNSQSPLGVQRTWWWERRRLPPATLSNPWQYSTAAAGWALVMDSGPPTGQDIYVQQDGHLRKLTGVPGDDIDPHWSHDGKTVVFATGRWHPRSWYDIGIVPAAGGEVQQITGGDQYDRSPVFSADDQRIAFSRDFRATSDSGQFCWVERFADPASKAMCRTVHGAMPLIVLAWIDSHTILTEVTDTSGNAIATFDFTTGYLGIVRQGVQQAESTDDGAWVFCNCQVNGELLPMVIRVRDRAILGVRLDPGVAVFNAAFRERRRESPPARIHIVAPLTADTGVIVLGLTREPPALREPDPVTWSATNGATIDSTGRLHASRTGTILVTARSGSARDSARITIAPAASRRLFRDSWTDTLASEWVTFGIPRPQVIRGADGAAWLWPAGDSSDASGVHTRSAFSPAGGIGVEATVMTRIDRDQWQNLALDIRAERSSALLFEWDHVVGSPPAPAWVCGFGYPSNEGRRALQTYATVLPNAIVPTMHPATAAMLGGRPYRLLVQIFQDGTCGLAVDGKPVVRSSNRGDTRFPVRVFITSMTFKTRGILVGPIEVWEGVRPGIDWSAVDRIPLR